MLGSQLEQLPLSRHSGPRLPVDSMYSGLSCGGTAPGYWEVGSEPEPCEGTAGGVYYRRFGLPRLGELASLMQLKVGGAQSGRRGGCEVGEQGQPVSLGVTWHWQR